MAGNGMLQAAKDLGWTEIEAVRTKLTGAERKAYAIADNRTAELAEWDWSKLADSLQELDNGQFNVDLTGFSGADIESLMHGLDNAAIKAEVDVPEVWNVVVECQGEPEQKAVYEKLVSEGKKCRLLTL